MGVRWIDSRGTAYCKLDNGFALTIMVCCLTYVFGSSSFCGGSLSQQDEEDMDEQSNRQSLEPDSVHLRADISTCREATS